ncbi:hypothetical protein KSS87_000858 [Heliosperma pusillum]|nr:hypothetical protein KSS87_000858 [Heliosperma pusillum]
MKNSLGCSSKASGSHTSNGIFCIHNYKAILKTVKKGRHIGRDFYGCPLWPNNGCGFFLLVKDIQSGMAFNENTSQIDEYEKKADYKLKKLKLKNERLKMELLSNMKLTIKNPKMPLKKGDAAEETLVVMQKKLISKQNKPKTKKRPLEENVDTEETSPKKLKSSNKKKSNGDENKKLAIIKPVVDDKMATNKLQTKCRPGQLVELINSLSKEQKEAVREIGFGGLLQLKVTVTTWHPALDFKGI